MLRRSHSPLDHLFRTAGEGALTNLPTATPRKSILAKLVHRFPNEILSAVGGPLTCQSNFFPDVIQSGELKRRFLAEALSIEHADFSRAFSGSDRRSPTASSL